MIVFGRKNKSEAEAPPREGFVKRLRARLNSGNSWLTYDLANLVPGGKIDEDVLDELESRLVTADVGVEATERIMEHLRRRLSRKELKDVSALMEGLRKALTEILSAVEKPLVIPEQPRPFVILVVGVNGAGKSKIL